MEVRREGRQEVGREKKWRQRGGLDDGESTKRGGGKRHKRGKNGTKGQLFITLRDGAGGPAIIWCAVESM